MVTRTLSSLGLLLAIGCGHSSPPAAAPAAGTVPAASAAPAGTAPGAPSPSNTAPAESPPEATTVSVFVVHQIDDFAAFESFLERTAPRRQELGVRGKLVSRAENGSHRVLVHYVADALDRIEAFLKSPELDEYLNQPGASESALVWLARDIELSVPPSPPANSYSLLTKAPVRDFEAWRADFDGIRPALPEYSVVAYGVHQTTADPNVVILHLVGTDRTQLENLYAERIGPSLEAAGAPKKPPIIAHDVRAP